MDINPEKIQNVMITFEEIKNGNIKKCNITFYCNEKYLFR